MNFFLLQRVKDADSFVIIQKVFDATMSMTQSICYMWVALFSPKVRHRGVQELWTCDNDNEREGKRESAEGRGWEVPPAPVASN